MAPENLFRLIIEDGHGYRAVPVNKRVIKYNNYYTLLQLSNDADALGCCVARSTTMNTPRLDCCGGGESAHCSADEV